MTGGVSASRHRWSGRGSGVVDYDLLLEGHPLTFRTTALLVLFGCEVGDLSVVLLACMGM